MAIIDEGLIARFFRGPKPPLAVTWVLLGPIAFQPGREIISSGIIYRVR